MCPKNLLVKIFDVYLSLPEDKETGTFLARTTRNVEELSQFVAALSAGTACGASVGEVLKNQSKHVFKRRRQELHARANKLSARMIMPIGFLMLPAVILAFAAPVTISRFVKLPGVQ